MRLLVAADSKFFKTPDGRYWCKTIYEYNFWQRYLNVFENVIVVSRSKDVEYREVEGFLRVDGPNLVIEELPYMEGMSSYINNYYSFTNAVKKSIVNADCAVIRLPSVSSSMVLKYFKKLNKPYAIEIVADPYDAYSTNRIAQKLYTYDLKKAALSANGVSYVTKYYLQKKYPSTIKLYGEKERYFESYYSTINLSKSFFSIPKKINDFPDEITLVHTANSINNDMKGHDILLKTVKNLKEKGYKVKAKFIGDGHKRSHYEGLARKMDIEKNIFFTGLLPYEEVRETLLNADIFVFPTKAEGLPRAIIEAMAVGLPCLSTPVNGIPELLEEEYLFDPVDDTSFTQKIIDLINNKEELVKMSEKNIEKAKEYENTILTIRRNEFYSKLKSIVGSVNKRHK